MATTEVMESARKESQRDQKRDWPVQNSHRYSRCLRVDDLFHNDFLALAIAIEVRARTLFKRFDLGARATVLNWLSWTAERTNWSL